MRFTDQPSNSAKTFIGLCFLVILLSIVAAFSASSAYIIWLILRNMGIF